MPETTLELITPDEGVRLYLRDRQKELADATIDSYQYKLEKFVEWYEAEDVANLNSLSGRDLLRFKYFATVKDAVRPEEAELSRPIEEYADGAKIADDKIVIRFQANSVYELEAPVPHETKYPQGLRDTTLGELRSAEPTDDML